MGYNVLRVNHVVKIVLLKSNKRKNKGELKKTRHYSKDRKRHKFWVNPFI